MKVSAVCSDPAVTMNSNNEPLVLELVAHSLGMAIHHNDNAPPAAEKALLEPRQNFLGIGTLHTS